MNSHSPILQLDITPPTVPASSPDDLEYLAPLTMGICPSVVTALGPPLVSEACPMLGYGMGTAPAGGGGFLPHTGNPHPPPAAPLVGDPPEVDERRLTHDRLLSRLDHHRSPLTSVGRAV